MSLLLRFEGIPTPTSNPGAQSQTAAAEPPFDPVTIYLSKEDEAFVIGYRQSQSQGQSQALGGDQRGDSGDTTTTTSAYADDNLNESRANSPSTATGRKPGFSEYLEDDKLCIVPLNSEEAKQMQDPLGGIWLAPGYKVRFFFSSP